MALTVELPGKDGSRASIKLKMIDITTVTVTLIGEDSEVAVGVFDRFEMEEWLRVAGSKLRES